MNNYENTLSILSQEICQKCGIKPQIVTDYELNEIEIYPDFSEPNNFVKLMELNFTRDLTIGSYIQSYEDSIFRGWYNRESFLKILNNVLYYTEIRRTRLIKKAIRNTKWLESEVE